MQLTNDSKKLLYSLYKEYSNRRAYNVPKIQSKCFGASESIQENFAPSATLDDVREYLRELDRNGFVSNFYGNGDIRNCELTDFAISTMEKLPKENFLSVADFISKFIP